MHEENVRQLKSRVRGGNADTLVHTVTYTSDIELVPDMCPEKQRSIYDGYNVADAFGFVRQMFRGSANLWGQDGDVEGCR